VIAKFGGSAIGVDGEFIPIIIKRINELKKDSKIIGVFSAPLTLQHGKKRSLTDIILDLGNKAETGENVKIDLVKETYEKMLRFVDDEYKDACKDTIDSFLDKSLQALRHASEKKEFADVVRSKALAYSGEILMSHMMNYILKSNEIKSDAVGFDIWPIITDTNVESANFLPSHSFQKAEPMENLLEKNDVLLIGGFIGKTIDGLETTYERGCVCASLSVCVYLSQYMCVCQCV